MEKTLKTQKALDAIYQQLNVLHYSQVSLHRYIKKLGRIWKNIFYKNKVTEELDEEKVKKRPT
jgi:hypothetical protein